MVSEHMTTAERGDNRFHIPMAELSETWRAMSAEAKQHYAMLARSMTLARDKTQKNEKRRARRALRRRQKHNASLVPVVAEDVLCPTSVAYQQ
eukprot:5017418-Amphidinium_carterae.1